MLLLGVRRKYYSAAAPAGRHRSVPSADEGHVRAVHRWRIVASMLAVAMPLARLFAAVFVVGQTLLLMRWWRRVAAEHRIVRDVGLLASAARTLTVLLVLDAVAAGCHYAPTIEHRVGPVVDLTADLDHLQCVGLLVGVWKSSPARRCDDGTA